VRVAKERQQLSAVLRELLAVPSNQYRGRERRQGLL
jgi:hypothetical protein